MGKTELKYFSFLNVPTPLRALKGLSRPDNDFIFGYKLFSNFRKSLYFHCWNIARDYEKMYNSRSKSRLTLKFIVFNVFIY